MNNEAKVIRGLKMGSRSVVAFLLTLKSELA